MGISPCLQPGDAVLVLVDAGDVPTEVGKTGGGNQADITRANHANFHGDPLTLTGRKLRHPLYGLWPEAATPEQHSRFGRQMHVGVAMRSRKASLAAVHGLETARKLIRMTAIAIVM